MNPNKKTVPVDYDDPFEAIFALNVGDFVAEDFLSKDLLEKIRTKINCTPEEKIIRLKKQLQELVSIYSIGNTLNLLGFDKEESYIVNNSIATTIAYMVNFDLCNIFLKPEILSSLDNNETKELVLFATSSDNKLGDNGYSHNNTDIQTKAYRDKKLLIIENVKKQPYWKPSNTFKESEAVTFVSVPMISNRVAIGMINLYKFKEQILQDEHINLLKSIAAIFATSIKLQDLMDEANELIKNIDPEECDLTRLRAQLTSSIGDLGIEQQNFVEALAKAVDAKSEFTKNHSENVAVLAKEIAEELNLNEKTVDLIYYAGLLQNIGKIIIPNEIFSKAHLSEDDWNKLKEHPNRGVDLLMKVNFLSEVVPYVHYYKERWDGKGIPEGLAGMSIPLGSRIIAVADAFQAMISDRAYRKNMTVNQALKTIKQESGGKWDPIVVDALEKIKL